MRASHPLVPIILLSVALGTVVANPAATAQTATRTQVITADQLLARLGAKEPLLILDVRTPEEFAAGHVPGAVNIPHTQIAEHLDEVRKAGDVDVVVYCRSGRRAGSAERVLRENGFDKLLHLQGDMLDWMAKGRPVEKGEPSSRN